MNSEEDLFLFPAGQVDEFQAMTMPHCVGFSWVSPDTGTQTEMIKSITEKIKEYKFFELSN